jgi:catechol 2,3-dioxygenase-like lactoylglutathione lyase family enzyme
MHDSVVVRAVDHLGITVPNIEEATSFLVAALGAEVLYDMTGPDPESRSAAAGVAALGVRPEVRFSRSRMLRLGKGASLELFEFVDPHQRPAHTASDIGIQHLAVYVDDIHRARQRIIEAGGEAYPGPSALGGVESGEGNAWAYTRAPWGSIVELITYPSPQPYEEETQVRRWRPEK